MKKKNFNEYLEEYKDFIKGIVLEKDKIYIKAALDGEWELRQPSNKNIKLAHINNTNGLYAYYGEPNKVSLEDIMNALNETILFNKELDVRGEILEEKQKELLKIVLETPLKKLENLSFCFRKKTKKDEPEITEVKDKTSEPPTKDLKETISENNKDKK